MNSLRESISSQNVVSKGWRLSIQTGRSKLRTETKADPIAVVIVSVDIRAGIRVIVRDSSGEEIIEPHRKSEVSVDEALALIRKRITFIW